MKKAGLHIASVMIIVLLSLPAIQMNVGIFKENPLEGAFTLAEKPSFSQQSWMKGQFQAEVESYLKDHSGFRSFLIRLQNQVDFTFFSQANAEGAVVGRNKQLFEYDYIRSWLALDYPGDTFLEKKLQRTKWVQEYLKREKDIDLVVVFEPGKASFYPEYLPGRFTRLKEGASTYEIYRDRAAEIGIDFIDLHNYFMQLKSESQYPLFPRYGTHWSVYGMQFAADSLLRLIEHRRGIRLTAVKAESMEYSDEPRDTDDDVLKTMNLLVPMQGETLAYPVLSFDTAHPGEKPMVLTIADSYYWNFFNSRIPKYVFANEAFWYFNTLVYPDHYLKPTYTKDLDFAREVEKQQVIFLMITERFVHKFDWRFIDQLYELYTPDWLEDPVYNKINDIMQVAPWYADMIEKAEKKNLPLEEILINEGKFMFLQDDTIGYMIHYGLEHFSRTIASDSGWMNHIRLKAKEQNISVDEMLLADALFIFKQDYPDLFELNRGLAATSEKIMNDPVHMARCRTEAYEYGCDPVSYVRLKAWHEFKEEEMKKTGHAIMSDPAWLAQVKKKAMEKGISMDEMIRLDAEYMFDQRLNKK